MRLLVDSASNLACLLQLQIDHRETFATAADASSVGPDADIIVSPVIVFYVTKGKRISWDRSTCGAGATEIDTFYPSLDKEVCVLARQRAKYALPYVHALMCQGLRKVLCSVSL